MTGSRGVAGPAAPGQPDRETIVRAIEAQRVQALEELIRTTIQRNTWAPEGAIGTLSHYEGLLVVDHTARAHQSLADLLSVMRQALTARPQASARPAGGFPGATPPSDAAVPGFGPVRGATARGHGPMGVPGSTRPADSGR